MQVTVCTTGQLRSKQADSWSDSSVCPHPLVPSVPQSQAQMACSPQSDAVGVARLCAVVRSGTTLVLDGSRGEVIVSPTSRRSRITRSGEPGNARARRRSSLPDGHPRWSPDREGREHRIAFRRRLCPHLRSGVGRLVPDGAPVSRSARASRRRGAVPVAVLTALGGRPATFWTLDIGGEKLPFAVTVARTSASAYGDSVFAPPPDILRTQIRPYRAFGGRPAAHHVPARFRGRRGDASVRGIVEEQRTLTCPLVASMVVKRAGATARPCRTRRERGAFRLRRAFAGSARAQEK
jgi:hypothetical protein